MKSDSNNYSSSQRLWWSDSKDQTFYLVDILNFSILKSFSKLKENLKNSAKVKIGILTIT